MERSEQLTDSLYDFIYIDDHKSKILLAQIEANGILTQVISRIKEEECHSGEAGMDKIVVAKKIGQLLESESVEHSFDTSSSIHLSLLNKLGEQNRINRDITKASIGEIVLFTGDAYFLDIETLQKTVPLLKHFKKQLNKNDYSMVMDVLKLIPPSIQFIFKDYSDSPKKVWMTISSSNMLITASDLMLKYGNNLNGKWSVIGLLDSKPESLESIESLESTESISIDDREIGNSLGVISTIFKGLIGKHDSYYGITPIMIFREVNCDNTKATK
jgi:hypothetical protein